MERSAIDTPSQAAAFYGKVSDHTARSILDFLIDHPDERLEGADIVREFGLSEHREVARSTYQMGQIAAGLGLSRPWTEGQLGYLLSGHTADLLRQAREQLSAAAGSP